MNKAIELFGNHIYNLTPKNPLKARKELSFVFGMAGLKCKYFPQKRLLPSRQFMQWAASDSAVKPLKNGKGSSIVSIYLPCEILHAMGIRLMLRPLAVSRFLLKQRRITDCLKQCVHIIKVLLEW